MIISALVCSIGMILAVQRGYFHANIRYRAGVAGAAEIRPDRI